MTDEAGTGRLTSESEEDENGPTETDHLLVIEPTDLLAEFGSRDSRDLVHHQAARLTQPVGLIWFDVESKQRRIGLIGGERTHRHRIGRVEAIVLDYRDRTRLPDVPAPRRSCPDLTTSQSLSTLIASMNAWSSLACRLVATAADWRCASRRNSGERTSGTQICTGRSP